MKNTAQNCPKPQSWRRRSRRALISGVSVLLGVSVWPFESVSAALFTWKDFDGGNWNTTASWDAGIPVGGSTTSLLFGGALGSYTATNDISGAFALNGVTFLNETVAGLTVANGSNSLQFTGTDAFLTQSGGGPVTISGGTINLASSTTINGSGDGALAISSILTGSAGLTLNRTSTAFTATTTLSGANTGYSGTVTLQSGSLVVGSNTALGTGTLRVSTTGYGLATTGDLRASSTMAIANQVAIDSGATLNLLAGGQLTFNGTIGGGGLQVGTEFTIVPVFLQAAGNTLTELKVAGGLLTIQNAGTITTSSLPVSIGRGATLTLSNTTTNVVNRLQATSTVDMARGTFTLTTNTTAGNASAQTLAAIRGESQNTLRVNPSANNSASLTVGDLARVNRGTFFVGFTNTSGRIGGTPGTANVATVKVTTIGGSAPVAALVGGGGGSGTTTQSILPFLTMDTASGGAGNTFATYDAVNGLRPLDTATEYATLSPVPGVTAPASNVRLTGSVGIGHAATINSLVLVGTGTGVQGRPGAGNSLTVTSGAILATAANQVIGVDRLNFGAAEGQFFLPVGSLTVYSQITGTNGITINGASGNSDNNLQLLNAANSFTGPVTINAGRLTIREDGALGNAANEIVLNGGILDAQMADGTIARNFTIGAAGGTLIALPVGGSATGSGQKVTLTGNISGSGVLRFNASPSSNSSNAIFVLSGDNSAYTGEMVIETGVLQVDADGRLGSGSRFMLSGGVLEATASFSSDKVIDFDATSGIRVAAGASLTLNGRINSTAGTWGLAKTGAGTLVLSAPANYTGATTLGAASGGAQSLGGDLVLSGGGQLTGTSGITFNSSSRLILSNEATNLNNRISSTTLTFANGTLRLEGNASAATTEVVGTASIGEDGFANIEVAPVGTQTATLVFSAATANPFAIGKNATVIFSAPGLSDLATSKARIHFLSTTTPTLTNGIMAGAFGYDGTSGGLVTTQAVTGGVAVRQLSVADYTSTIAASGTTANALVTTGESVGAAKTINALVINSATVSIDPGVTLGISTGNLVLNSGSGVSGAGSLAGSSTGLLSIFTPGTASDTTFISVGLAAARIAKSGGGKLTLSGTTSTFDTLNIFQGTVALGLGGAIPLAATVNVSAPATLDLNGNSANFGTLSGLGTVQLGNGAATLSLSTGDFGGSILGSGSIIKNGAGTLRFTESANVSQAITINAGTVLFGSGSGALPVALVSGGDVTIADGATLATAPVGTFARNIQVNVGSSVGNANFTFGGATGNTTTVSGNIFVDVNKTLTVQTTSAGQALFTGIISGAGSLIYTGMTIASISGNNTYTGTTALQSSATIYVGSDTAFGNGGALNVGAAGATARLATYNGNRTITNPVTFNADVNFTGGNNLSFTGSTTLGTNAGVGRTFTVDGAGTLGLTSVANGTTATNLTKAGSGSLQLSGVSTYTGTTTVNAGELRVSGSIAASSQTTLVGGSLSGTGTVGALAMTGGVLAPGDEATTAGTLNAGNTTFSGGILALDIQSPLLADQLNVSGSVAFSTNIELSLQLGYNPSGPASWIILTNDDTDAIGLSGGRFMSNGLAIQNLVPFDSGGQSWFLDYAGGTGNDVVLHLVPEPATLGLMLAGLPLLLRRRRPKA